MSAPRLGVLGGTFDPLHVGHLVVAQDVVERLELDRLLVVPAGRPPHRDAVLPADIRLRFVRRAFAGDGRVEVSDLELRRPGPSYTVDTLAEIREERSPSELFCVMGVDQLREFDTWHEPERILELARLAVMARAGVEPDEADVPDGVAFTGVEVTRVDVSGTRIRRRLGEGRTVRYLVPESVRAGVESAWAEATGDRGRNDRERSGYKR